MLELKPMEGGVGFFKGGIYGNAGSGKTHTSTLIACGIRKHLGLEGPIGFFDTESGAEYVAPMIREATGKAPIGAKSRSLQDAIDFIGAAKAAGVSVAIIDSVTHIWEEVQKSFLRQLNEARARRNLNPKANIEWQDRGPLNDIWAKFTDAYLASELHLIICGRAANIWEMSVNDEGKKELNRVGTRMKTQSEMAYEPSFLAEMEREQIYEAGAQKVVRTMTVLKDRFRVLDGKQFQNPTFEAVLPHVALLRQGAVNTIDLARSTTFPVTDEGDVEWNTEKRKRVIYAEEIQGLLVKFWPGQSAQEKQAKLDIVEKLLGTRSWTLVEGMNSDKLKAALDSFGTVAKEYNALMAGKSGPAKDGKVKTMTEEVSEALASVKKGTR